MRSIRTRLFLVFSATGMVLVLLAATLYQMSFERGLVDYLQQRETMRMEEIADRLADSYEHYEGWPSESDVDHPRGVRAALRLPRHLIVLDKNGDRVSGVDLEDRQQKDITIRLRNKKVGTLRYHPMQAKITDSTDKAFMRQQLRSLAVTTLAALLVALLGSWALARQIGQPLRNMAQQTQRMARGNYNQRMTSKRKDELGLLSESINLLADHLEQAAQARDRWLADTAHELRTPLAILQGEIEALVDGIRKPDPEQLSSIQQEVIHLRRLVNDLHDLALADQGSLRYRMEAVDLSVIAEEQAQLFERQFNDYDLQFSSHIDQALMVEGDGTRLRQLISNLLSNSLSYTEAPGVVQLHVNKNKHDIVLRVIDSAPAVAEDKLPMLFEHLFRDESASRNRQFGGSGLGLALVKRIAQAHNAELNAELSELGGLQITLRFKELA